MVIHGRRLRFQHSVVPGLSNSNRPDFFHPTVYPYRDEELIADHEDRGSAMMVFWWPMPEVCIGLRPGSLGDSGIRLGSRAKPEVCTYVNARPEGLSRPAKKSPKIVETAEK